MILHKGCLPMGHGESSVMEKILNFCCLVVLTNMSHALRDKLSCALQGYGEQALWIFFLGGGFNLMDFANLAPHPRQVFYSML